MAPKTNTTPLSTLSESEIARRLSDTFTEELHSPYPPEFFKEPAQPAAILIPFICINGEWHLLFIRRTVNDNDRHGGQVAFPGGRMDPDDPTIEATALREAFEEVGIKPTDIKILGRMHDFHSITNYRVTPIVGSFPWPYPLHIDPREVSRMFTIPLNWLADPANHQTIFRHFPQTKSWPVIYFDPFDGEALWGFTAHVVVQLLESLR